MVLAVVQQVFVCSSLTEFNEFEETLAEFNSLSVVTLLKFCEELKEVEPFEGKLQYLHVFIQLPWVGTVFVEVDATHQHRVVRVLFDKMTLPTSFRCRKVQPTLVVLL